MIIAVNRSTGKLYCYSPDSTTYVSDFIFEDTKAFHDVIVDDGTEHEDDFILFEISEVFKPDVIYREIDYDDGCIY